MNMREGLKIRSGTTGRRPAVLQAFLDASARLLKGGSAAYLSFPVRKKLWLQLGLESLEDANIDPLQYLMMTSALTARHEDSGFDRLEYLSNVIRAYNSKQLSEKEKLDLFKEDIVKGSDGKITEAELEDVLSFAIPQEGGTRSEFCSATNKEEDTYSAIPKEQLFPIMASLRADNAISFEQAALVLSINLHARERRRNGGRYLDHPMAIAGMVLKEGKSYFDNKYDLAVALVVALMHDTGEKSNYVPSRDYPAFMPEDVVGCIDRMHKKEDQSYFEYIRNCAGDKRTAVVKFYDLRHNCSDATLEKASFKQKFIYPIASAYIMACFENPLLAEKMTVKDFAVRQGLCDETTFDAIDCVSGKDMEIYRDSEIQEIENSLELDRLALNELGVYNHIPFSSLSKSSPVLSF